MQSVPRSRPGMNTISIACAAPAASTHLRVPSLERCSLSTCGAAICARVASSARSERERSVMASTSSTPDLYIQRMTWRAWNGFSPSCVNKLSSSARGIPSRLSRSADMDFTCPISARKNLRRVEEEGNLLPRRVGAVGAMHHVALDALGEVRADGARRRLLRVGGAHHLAMLRDRVLAFEHLHDDRTGSHVADEIAVEGTLAVHGIETLRLLLGESQHACRDDAQAGALEARVALPIRFLATPSGLTMDKVRSAAMRSVPRLLHVETLAAPALVRDVGVVQLEG